MNLDEDKKTLYIGLFLVLAGLLALMGHVFFADSPLNLSEKPIRWEYSGAEVHLDRGEGSSADSRKADLGRFGRSSARKMFEKRKIKVSRSRPRTAVASSPEDPNKKEGPANGKTAEANKKDPNAKDKAKKEGEEGEKKIAENPLEEQSPEEAENNEDQQDNNEDTDPTQVNAPSPISTTVVGEEGDEKATVKEWLDRFSQQTNKKTLIDFLTAYRDGELSDDEFYEVIDELLVTEDVELGLLAINALESQRSVRSYVKLVDLAYANTVKLPKKVFEFATKSVDRFGHIGNLQVLKDVIVGSGSEQAVVQSARLIRIILKKSLERSSQTPEGEISTLSLRQKEVIKLYKLIPLLEQVRDEVENQTVITAITTTLSDFETAQTQFPFDVTTITQSPPEESPEPL